MRLAARWLVIASHCVNVTLSGRSGVLLLGGHKATALLHGGLSTASRVLIGLYFAEATGSAVALVLGGGTMLFCGMLLFPLQILYKLVSAVAIIPTEPDNLIAYYGLAVAALHTVTLAAAGTDPVLLPLLRALMFHGEAVTLLGEASLFGKYFGLESWEHLAVFVLAVATFVGYSRRGRRRPATWQPPPPTDSPPSTATGECRCDECEVGAASRE